MNKSTPRRRLLVAGEELAAQGGAKALTLNALLQRADVPKKDFTKEFKSLRNYVVELLHGYFEDVLADVIAAFEGRLPGAERLRHGLTAYWDANLLHRPVRSLMNQMMQEQSVRDWAESRIRGFALIVTSEFKAVGVAEPEPLAQLFTAAAVEVADTENQGGRPLPEMREAFWQYFSAFVPE